MTDVTLDTLLEAVRFLVSIHSWMADEDKEFSSEFQEIRDKLDALIAQRHGRLDDQPAK